MSMVTMKKIIATLVVAITMISVAAPVFAAATVSTSKYTSAKTSFDVKVGKTLTVYIKSNDYKGNIYWTISSGRDYVKILGGTNSYCEFEGLKAGKAVIKIREGSASGKVAEEFTINVKNTTTSTSKTNNKKTSNNLSFLEGLLDLAVQGIDTASRIASGIAGLIGKIRIDIPKDEPKEETTKPTTPSQPTKPTTPTKPSTPAVEPVNPGTKSIKDYTITKDSIVKTNASGALPAVTRAELKKMIENARITSTGNRRRNLLAQLDTFMQIQTDYKVNALFAVAVAIQESGAGTSSRAINQNNWFGIKKGGSFKSYATPADSIRNFGTLISGNTYFGSGKTTPNKIEETYCNSSWGGTIVSHMNSLKAYL